MGRMLRWATLSVSSPTNVTRGHMAHLEVPRACSCNVVDNNVHHQIHPSGVESRRQCFEVIARTKVVILLISYQSPSVARNRSARLRDHGCCVSALGFGCATSRDI